jgi:hypothetical protein
MRLRFTKGINKAVILGMVDQMLANKVGLTTMAAQTPQRG